MDKLSRAIVHEVAETAGISSCAFGVEEEDRFVMLFKKEFAPTDEQMAVYRSGATYDPREVDEILRKREAERKSKLMEENEAKAAAAAATASKRNKGGGGNSQLQQSSTPTSASDYHNKYQHLIGTESAATAAKSMHANAAYGFVTSENKKDKRSIEETLADIRSKKKLKTEEGERDGEGEAETNDEAESDAE